MFLSNIIPFIKLLFSKDRELYAFIRSTTGFLPHDIFLYKLAFVHRSMPVKSPDGHHWANNERLEYLGDGILDAVVADYLYRHYPNQHEGFLTATRAKIVQRESLNRIGGLMHLDQRVRAAAHSQSHNSYINGNAVEALVGAVYLDRGYDVAQKFIVERIIKQHINLGKLVKTEQNFKSRLIEWTQKYHVTIEFELIDTYADSENNPIFKTAVIIGGIFAGDAVGYSKKESHQGASKLALKRIKSDNMFRRQVLATAEVPDTSDTP